MIRSLADVPRKVLISLAVMAGSFVIFIVLLFVLGGARDDAFADNNALNLDIGRTKASVTQSQADREYVVANQAKFEELLKGNKLIPHTRRAAIVEIESAARANGLTTLSYSIAAATANSPKVAETQSTTTGYRLSVETIALKVGAPIDGALYRFIDDLNTTFPGSAVIEAASIKRAASITTEALVAVSEGKDAQLVSGEITLSWRTAQAQDNDAGSKGK